MIICEISLLVTAANQGGILLATYAPINVGGGEGRAWGGDFIVFVGPGVGHLTDLVLPGEGIFESFFARRGRKRLRPNIPYNRKLTLHEIKVWKLTRLKLTRI